MVVNHPYNSSRELVRIPNIFDLTPFKWQGVNPHHSPTIRSTAEWVLSHGTLDDLKRQRLDDVMSEFFGAVAYPYADYEMLLILNDAVSVVFLLDEFTDVLDYKGVKSTKETVMNALTGKSSDDRSLIANFTRDLEQRLSSATPGLDRVMMRFCHTFDMYLEALAAEAKHRENGQVLSVEDYIIHRRENSSIRIYYVLIELSQYINFPEELLSDPEFINANNYGVDLSAIVNDVYSFAMEYYRGLEGNNIVAAFMRDKSCSVQEAFDYTASFYKVILEKFLVSRSRIQSYGPDVDKDVERYMSGIEQWVWGSAEWSLDNNRYSDKGSRMRQTHIIELKREK